MDIFLFYHLHSIFFLLQYRVVLNGFGYILFGIPDRDLNRTWRNGNTINSIPGHLPLLVEAAAARQTVCHSIIFYII